MKNLRTLASTLVMSISLSAVIALPTAAFAKADTKDVKETYVKIAYASYNG